MLKEKLLQEQMVPSRTPLQVDELSQTLLCVLTETGGVSPSRCSSSDQLCGKGKAAGAGRGCPLLKCQRSDLIPPGAPPPVSAQGTTASATAALQPHAGCLHKGRITSAECGEPFPSPEGSRILWKYSLYLSR